MHDMLKCVLGQQPAVSAALQFNELRKTVKEVRTLGGDSGCNEALKIERLIDEDCYSCKSKESSQTLSVVAPLHAQLIQDFQESRADSEIVKEIKVAICQDVSKRYMD